jgi:CBS domain
VCLTASLPRWPPRARPSLTTALPPLHLRRTGRSNCGGQLQANAHLVRRVSDLNLGAVLVMPADALLSALELGDGPSAPEHVVVLGGADQIVGVALRTRLLEQAEGGDKTRLLADIARRDFVTIPESATLVELLGRMATAHASVAVVMPSSPEAGAKPVVGIITQSAMAEALAAGMELFGD